MNQNKSQRAIEDIFPPVLKDPILRKVQFSTISRIDDLGKSWRNPASYDCHCH
jgi:hypothetical protein